LSHITTQYNTQHVGFLKVRCCKIHLLYVVFQRLTNQIDTLMSLSYKERFLMYLIKHQ